jgi:cyclophilin family peptidyl-prolyl cis-trans isomerase/protein-disulfide isomerase
MFKRLKPQAIGLVSVILLSLLLAACGGAAQPASKEPATSAQTQETTGLAETEEATSPSTTEPEAQQPAATEAAPDENPVAATSAQASCQPVDIPSNTLIAPVLDQEWSKGPADAPVTLIEYADFQCPGCAGVFPSVEKLKADYGDDLRVVFRHFPLLSIHDKAKITAEAAEAAGAQGKFWEMHDLLFERQSQWDAKPEAEMIELLVGYAEEAGVEDLEKFQAELENHAYADKVQAAYDAAVKSNLNSTPSFVVNGVDYPAQGFGLSYQGLDAFMKLMRLRDNWYSQPEQVIDAEKQYVATIKTEKGDIVIELFADTAPVNVNSFVFLAQKGWYKGLTFHRVLPGFVAQGGDPTGIGIGFPGYRCDDEVNPERTFDKAGLVSLANSGPDSNGSQFFITYDAVPQLNEGFTIIGRVIEGMDVAEGITPRDPQTTPDAPPGDTIVDITVEEKS